MSQPKCSNLGREKKKVLSFMLAQNKKKNFNVDDPARSCFTQILFFSFLTKLTLFTHFILRYGKLGQTATSVIDEVLAFGKETADIIPSTETRARKRGDQNHSKRSKTQITLKVMC